ncbi:hypothetical protein [Ureaplasma urealyticum]|uniref:hypothetical protein n=1 Tax=Ureaplasma urealyticum TaxID=2130 RepID=UPI00114EC882|nr:hypothetical protein [Ureaplasma urealyticum]QDI63701.1 hypothetical protein EPH05_01715 [Ureaplasma urealyticum]
MIDKQKTKQLIQNPINGFFDGFKKTLNNDLDKIINQQLKGQEDNINEINELTKKIKELQGNIKQRKKSEKINQRIFCNILIGICFVIIVGLFFLHFYLKNRKIIKNFKNFENEKVHEINTCNKHKNLYVYNVLMQVNPYKISQQIFAKNGLYLMPEIQYENIKPTDLTISHDAKFVGFFGGIEVKFKSTDTFLVYYKEFSIKDVITSGTIQISYRRGDEIISETLVAHHKEPTPFVDLRSNFIHKTNYAPEFNFSTYSQSVNSRSKSIFANLEFSKYYGLGISTQNLQFDTKMLEFFTPFSQENYENFAKYLKQEDKMVPMFTKTTTSLVINDELSTNNIKPYFINLLTNESYAKTCDFLIDTNINADLQTNLNTLKYQLTKILEKYILYLTTTSLSSVIAREWYINNNSYKIGDNYDYENYYYANQNELTPSSISTKLFLKNQIAFINDCKVIPFAKLVNSQIRFGINKAQFNIKSYHVYDRVDAVPVYAHGRTHVIPVPYQEYIEYEYPFICLYILKRKQLEKDISLKYFLRTFDNLLLSNFEDHSDWSINDILDFSDDDLKKEENKMLQIYLKELDTIVTNANLNRSEFSFLVDNDGYFITISNKIELDEQTEQELCTWLRKVSM